MKNFVILMIILLTAIGCKQKSQIEIEPWVPFDETELLKASANHPSAKMQFKLIQSQVLDKNKMWQDVVQQLKGFSHEEYLQLMPFIVEQTIPQVQSHINSGALTYEKLTQWFLYRIVQFENNKELMLNAIVAVNPNAVKEAREKDKQRKEGLHPIYGMPVIVKDNINAEGMPTTAGSHILRNNYAPDAAVIAQIKERGGIILGKTNMTEWANYFFNSAPNGFSAVGGQTLSTYGRRVYDTGGSSSGSGVGMAANFAMASIGTETSGSILSPSSKSSLVGLKPTVGTLSTKGIIPLASTLDTPGPMTLNVIDNAILFSAMGGGDLDLEELTNRVVANSRDPLEGLRFGVNLSFLNDSLYRDAITKIEELGGVVIEFNPVEVDFSGFGTLLSADMKVDLAAYLEEFAGESVTARSIEDIVEYNLEDPEVRIPYGQGVFESMTRLNITPREHEALKERLKREGRRYFETPMDEHQLDIILSIDNFNARHAAPAHFPGISVPMGYTSEGSPSGITFIARPMQEMLLLKIAYAYEQATHHRKAPK